MTIDTINISFANKRLSTSELLLFILTLPVLVLFIGQLVHFSGMSKRSVSKTNGLTIGSASSIQTLNPSEYDEWGSLFIGNHIYPRLLQDERSDRSIAFGKISKRSCVDTTSNRCLRERLTITISEMKSCAGIKINAKIIKKELAIILLKKNWLIPEWSFCPSNIDSEICLEVKNPDDIDRRLRSVYFRFGWSTDQPKSEIKGIAPYCFKNISYDHDGINSGTLVSAENRFPELKFISSMKSTDQVDIALYGSENLLNKTKKKLLVHTPAAYYLISSTKSINPQDLPWNFLESQNLIKTFLKSENLTIGDGDEFNNIIPKGEASFIDKSLGKNNTALTFLIPDYFHNCEILAQQLNKKWRQIGFLNAVSQCEDISKFIPERVIANTKKWDGFISPITPGGYFRNAIGLEYLSKTSNESWIRGVEKTEDYFFRLGLAQTFIVTSTRICNVLPNPMGLSDLLISDLELCN